MIILKRKHCSCIGLILLSHCFLFYARVLQGIACDNIMVLCADSACGISFAAIRTLSSIKVLPPVLKQFKGHAILARFLRYCSWCYYCWFLGRGKGEYSVEMNSYADNGYIEHSHELFQHGSQAPTMAHPLLHDSLFHDCSTSFPHCIPLFCSYLPSSSRKQIWSCLESFGHVQSIYIKAVSFDYLTELQLCAEVFKLFRVSEQKAKTETETS